MKTIGLLGGMSWESTELYYRTINEETKRRLGGLHSAPIVMVSVDFQPIEALQNQGAWDAMGDFLAREARNIEAAGADFLLICTNTMHKVAPRVEAAIEIPLLHIADATAARVLDAGLSTVGLLGTRFTMEQAFYRERLESHGLRVLSPPSDDMDIVHRTIYDELCQGSVREASRAEFLRIMEDLQTAGAEGVIEGCTEIGLLVGSEHTEMPLFDTATLHALSAVQQALSF